MGGFDIKQQPKLAAQEDAGTDVHVFSLDGRPLYYQDGDGNDHPVTITVAGVHSHRYRKIEAAQRQRRLRVSNLTGASIYDDNVEKAVACTVAWKGFLQGEYELPFTHDNIKMVYEQCPWVYEAVLEAMNDHARFFESQSTPSENTSESNAD